jgi:hypothetical protein
MTVRTVGCVGFVLILADVMLDLKHRSLPREREGFVSPFILKKKTDE